MSNSMAPFRRLIAYLRLLLSSFFNWWWAAITGFVSIASFLAVPTNGLILPPLAVSTFLLILFALLFLVLTILYQGWLLFDARLTDVKYVGLCTSEHDNYDAGLIFLLESPTPMSNGSVVELRRRVDGAECLVALLEIVESNANGHLQAQSIWKSPGHLRDLRSSKVQLADVIVCPIITRRALSRMAETRT